MELEVGNTVLIFSHYVFKNIAPKYLLVNTKIGWLYSCQLFTFTAIANKKRVVLSSDQQRIIC